MQFVIASEATASAAAACAAPEAIHARFSVAMLWARLHGAKPRLTALELRRRVCVQGLLRTRRFDDQFYVQEIDALERVRRAFEAARARSVGIDTRAREDRIFAL